MPGSVYEKQASGSALSQGGIVGRRERQKWGVTGGHLRAHSPEQPGYCPCSRLTPRRRSEAPSDGALGKRHAFVDLMLFFVGPVARRDSTAYPGFPGGAAGKNSPASAGDTRGAGSIPGLGRGPGGGNGSLRKYSCLENPMGRGTWWATVHGVTKSWTQLSMPALHYLGYSSLRRTAKHFRCRHSRLRSLPSLSVETHTVSQTEISRPDPPWLWLSGASATMLVP